MINKQHTVKTVLRPSHYRTNRQNVQLGIKCIIGHFQLYIGDLGLGIGDWIFGNRLPYAKIGWNRLEYAGIC